MSNDKLSLGVIGASATYGWGMRAHMPAFLGLPEYDLTAVCTTTKRTAEESASQYGARKSYWNYKDLISDPEIDIVDVCIKAPRHYEVVMAALEAGKHVFCEWPLGANSSQSEEMAKLAKEKGVMTMVGLQSRYAPSFQNLKSLVAQGYLGRMIAANMTMFLPGITRPRTVKSAWNADKEAGAHALNIATGHALDVFLWSLGELKEIQSIVATQISEWKATNISEITNTVSETTIPVTSPDNIMLIGKLENDALASVHIGSIPYHGTAFRLEVYGTEGTLIVTSDQMVEMVDPILRGAKTEDKELTVIPHPKEFLWTPKDVPSGVAVNMAQMFRQFATDIKAGRKSQPDFEEAARRHKTLDALEMASDKQGTVVIEG
ncbi:MAG: Gfo/Idh/MocA family oxidoreductase [Dehalococcoidia bacterium]|nr:Gfo/Idh/MocA family oxidoreductase [Dehalococcoidia bacterium]